MKLKDVISTADMERCGERTLPVLSMTMHDGIVLQADRFKKAIASKDLSSYKVVRRNQLVVSFPIDEGVLYIQDLVDAGIVSPAYAIWDIHANMVYPRYLGMFLRSPRSIQYYKSKLRGSTARRRTIPREDFLCMELPEVSITEQRKICVTLEKIKIVISECEQQINRLGEIVKSRFVEMFGDPMTNPNGWNQSRLDALCENLDGKRIPITSSDRIHGNIPYYGASGVVDYVKDYIFDEDILLVSEDGANLRMRSRPIAFSVSGKCWVNNHAHVLRFIDMATQKFVEYHIELSDVSGMLTGSTQPKLNQAQLNGMQIMRPPLALQLEFAAFVEKVDKLAFAARRRRDVARQLYRAKIQEFFG